MSQPARMADYAAEPPPASKALAMHQAEHHVIVAPKVFHSRASFEKRLAEESLRRCSLHRVCTVSLYFARSRICTAKIYGGPAQSMVFKQFLNLKKLKYVFNTFLNTFQIVFWREKASDRKNPVKNLSKRNVYPNNVCNSVWRKRRIQAPGIGTSERQNALLRLPKSQTKTFRRAIRVGGMIRGESEVAMSNSS